MIVTTVMNITIEDLCAAVPDGRAASAGDQIVCVLKLFKLFIQPCNGNTPLAPTLHICPSGKVIQLNKQTHRANTTHTSTNKEHNNTRPTQHPQATDNRTSTQNKRIRHKQ